ncbi:hypothetical protein SLS55_010342 [Diplodia seriata]|uniref:NAD(P)-binding protein n=1 Tax=Diplodia seriata TaxID=420778 RepID=A0ABR3BZS2_9PEZI
MHCLTINQSSSVQFVKADTRSWQSQVSAFKAAIRFHPAQTLDTVVAGAGNFSETFIKREEQGLRSLADTPAEPATVAWETNAIGTFFTAKLAQLYFELPPPSGTSPSPATTDDQPKSLILIASLAAYVDIPFMAAYTSSKYGVRGLFRSIRPVFAGRGHRVNLMAPWAIPTPMTAEWIPMFRAVGAAEGSMGQAVAAALRFAADPGVNGESSPLLLCEAGLGRWRRVADFWEGRAFAVGPRRVLDLGDEPEGWNAGKVMREMLEDDVAGWDEHVEKMLGLMGLSF